MASVANVYLKENYLFTMAHLFTWDYMLARGFSNKSHLFRHYDLEKPSIVKGRDDNGYIYIYICIHIDINRERNKGKKT